MKEFNRTGTFPERMRSLGLNSGGDKHRKSIYANNQTGEKVNPNQAIQLNKGGVFGTRMNSSDYGGGFYNIKSRMGGISGSEIITGRE